jgi:hypothetical protein
MVIVMQKGASPEARERVCRGRLARLHPARLGGREPHAHRRHRPRAHRGAARAPARASRRRDGRAHHQAVQARQPRVPARRQSRADRRRRHRRRPLRGRRRAVRRGERRAAPAAADIAKRHGAQVLRGGAFKPRTSPYSFQGLGAEGLRCWSRRARDDRHADRHRGDRARPGRDGGRERRHAPDRRAQHARTSRCSPRPARAASRCCSSAGCRPRSASSCRPPSTCCRRATPTWCCASAASAPSRPHALHARHQRRAVLKELSHLPVWVDPSHAAGRRPLVPSLALAAVAAGADGIIVEVHAHPEEAKSDAAQQLDDAEFGALMRACAPWRRPSGSGELT